MQGLAPVMKEMEQNNEKKLTKYDRKVMAKKAATKKKDFKSTLSILAALVIVAAILALAFVAPSIKKANQKKEAQAEYFQVNGESVSTLEFNFHKTNLVNNNVSFLSYFGITSMDALKTTVYDSTTGMTWDDYFNESVAVSIKENRALLADAKAKGLTFDVEEDYDAYIADIKEEATSANVTVDTYMTSMYGGTEKELRDIIKDNLVAIAYSEYLYETMAATEEEAQAEYEAKKKDYDSIDYRLLAFPADVTSSATEEELATAMTEAKKKAQEMYDKLGQGEDFETLCVTYAPEDKRPNYADSETDLSLYSGVTYYSSSAPYMDWLFEEGRTAGDINLMTDEDANAHYVVMYENRYMGDDVIDTIADSLTYNAVDAYITSISESYTISDPENHFPNL